MMMDLYEDILELFSDVRFSGKCHGMHIQEASEEKFEILRQTIPKRQTNKSSWQNVKKDHARHALRLAKRRDYMAKKRALKARSISYSCPPVLTPEQQQRSENARKATAALTPEQRSENARKATAALTPEQRSENARKAATARWAGVAPG
jgi:hypothetical protein